MVVNVLAVNRPLPPSIHLVTKSVLCNPYIVKTCLTHSIQRNAPALRAFLGGTGDAIDWGAVVPEYGGLDWRKGGPVAESRQHEGHGERTRS